MTSFGGADINSAVRIIMYLNVLKKMYFIVILKILYKPNLIELFLSLKWLLKSMSSYKLVIDMNFVISACFHIFWNQLN